MRRYNQVTIVGTINSELEIVEIDDKDRMELNYTIAVARPCADKDKGKWILCDTFKITCRGELADLSNKYLEIGDKILVDGHLTTIVDNGIMSTVIVATNIKFMEKEGMLKC